MMPDPDIDTDIDSENLERIRARHTSASHGPYVSQETEDAWSLHVKGFPFQILKAPKHHPILAEYWPVPGDAAFLTHSWQDVADLLAMVDTLTEHLHQAFDDANEAMLHNDATCETVKERDRLKTENDFLRTENTRLARVQTEHHDGSAPQRSPWPGRSWARWQKTVQDALVRLIARVAPAPRRSTGGIRVITSDTWMEPVRGGWVCTRCRTRVRDTGGDITHTCTDTDPKDV